MQTSQFNLRVPLPESNDVFLMNTLTDAQLVVSSAHVGFGTGDTVDEDVGGIAHQRVESGGSDLA